MSLTWRLERLLSQSVVSISFKLTPDLSISAYVPNGNFPKHSNFIMCILLRRCFARWPCILNAILQSVHLNGLGLLVVAAPNVEVILTCNSTIVQSDKLLNNDLADLKTRKILFCLNWHSSRSHTIFFYFIHMYVFNYF